MLQGSYGKEPFDLRLTVLRLLGKLHIITGVTLLGMLVFGGGYYVKNVLLQKETYYRAISSYYIEYDVEKELEVGTVHVNETTWNSYMQMDLFLEAVQMHLKENNALPNGVQIEMSNEELGAVMKAYVLSDLHVLTTEVTTNNPEKSMLIARAVEKTVVGEMADALREITGVRVVDSPDEAKRIIPDVRVGRAVILSAILSFFFVVLFLLLKETWEDSIHLPASVTRRYGLKCVGGLNVDEDIYATTELPANLSYFLKGKTKVAVCPVSSEGMPEHLLGALQSLCPDLVNENWFVTPAPLLCPEVCAELRAADGVLLLVSAGEHVGKNFERVLEFLKQQDCEITGVILNGVDVRMLKCYYLGMKKSEEV